MKRTMKTKKSLPWNPSAEQGGHNWIAGEGRAVCGFGCGAFDDPDDQSWVPPTTPHAICPLNPISTKVKFTLDWKVEAIPESEGGHKWDERSSEMRCRYCGDSVRLSLHDHKSPERPLPNGFCTNSPVRATRDRIETAMRERLATAPHP